jgi:phenylalanine-4-hydroxylase
VGPAQAPGLARPERRGSGLISSHGDAANALGPNCDRRPFSLKAVMEQHFEIDRFQEVLFVAESFDQLFEAVEEAKRLDH